MLDTLRAKPLKAREITNGYFDLKKNTPKQINQTNNNHVIKIHEDDAGEDCYIHSYFSDGAFAHVGNEFCLNFQKDPKKVDISYYYFSDSKDTVVYLYDMKVTFAGEDVLLHLFEQWKCSVADAKYCIGTLDCYQLVPRNIHIGVITEHNDQLRRARELESIRKWITGNGKANSIPSFIKHKRQATIGGLVSLEKILSEIEQGEVTIDGDTYPIDIRMFVRQTHSMYFSDGMLAPQYGPFQP